MVRDAGADRRSASSGSASCTRWQCRWAQRGRRDIRTPSIVRQQLTAVARQWRGRGVGRALKAAMLSQVHETHPEATVIGTNNAEVNAPILSINAGVGFTVAWRNVDYQVTRDALDEWERGLGASANEE